MPKTAKNKLFLKKSFKKPKQYDTINHRSTETILETILV